MSRTMFLVFSHKLTDNQKEDAILSLDVDNFIYLPEDLQKVWSNILPEVDDISSLIQPIKDWLKSRAKEEDYILVQGDFGATCELVSFLCKNSLRAIYATTKRDSIIKNENGQLIKKSIFKHVKFRRYRCSQN